jgi:transglutaminase-like putative cysteine protease
MKIHPPSYLPSVLLLCLLAVSPAPAWAVSDDWKPIDPAHLALKSSTVEKEADAEAIFWEVRIDDNPDGDLIFNHYIRVKVFTDRGRESQSKIDLLYGKIFRNEIKINDIAARTIKPDGSIVELNKKDIFDRTVVKASGLKYKARSFAMPAVEPGCIIEYRWREVWVNTNADNVRLQFQRDIPVQRVRYLIKPYSYDGMTFRSLTFHGNSSPWVKEKDGFYSTTMNNMPAIYDESRMPPENEVKTWMLIYYQNTSDDKISADKYWTDYAKRFYEVTKPLIKPNDEIKKLAPTLVADAKSDDEKLERLFEFCRTKIKNASNDASGLTPDERARLKDNKTPSDTLKRGVGTSVDIDWLFAALANASGFDARIVLSPDRGDQFFDKSVANSYFVYPLNIAVNVGGTWKFYNPGYGYIPFGMLRWQEEGQPALITDSKQPVWVETPMSKAEKSLVKRTARLKLSDDGTLEGDVHLEYTGHFAIERKHDMDDESDSEREESLKEEIKEQMSAAEIYGIRIENVTDHVKPLIYSFHVRIPNYAQRTGKRLFIQPAFFQHGRGPLFGTTGRKYPIYFHYPWSEQDQVDIELPKGYALDNAEAPAPFGSGDISKYEVSIAASTDGTLLIYKRKFFFGGGNSIVFPVESYSPLKNYFDVMHKQDNHSIALKQTATN